MSSRPLSTALALVATLFLAPAALALGGGSLDPNLESALLGAVPKALSPVGKVFMNRDEALALAFPGCKVERKTAYLDPQHVERVKELAKLEYDSTVAYTYHATKEGKWVGTAYFDTHRVRSMRETMMIVVQPDASVGRIEVLSFGEPVEYIPRERWYGQFTGHKLDGDLFLGRDIRGVTGATLTAVATTNCSRRVLALHQVLGEIAKAKREAVEKAKKKREADAKKKREAEAKKKGGGDGGTPPKTPPARSAHLVPARSAHLVPARSATLVTAQRSPVELGRR